MSAAKPIPLFPVILPEVIEAEFVDPDPRIRPVIQWVDEHLAVSRGIEILAMGRACYQRDGVLVHVNAPVRHGGHGSRAPKIVVVTPGWLRLKMSRLARFVKRGRNGMEPCMVPQEYCPLLLSAGDYPDIPYLKAVIQTAVFLPTGEILECSGYDPGSSLFLVPLRPTHPVPDRPTWDDAVQAVNDLFEVVQDFPFGAEPSAEAHRAAWVAWVLTLVGRYAIAGPVPFTLLEASSQASGKDLLVQVTSILALGRSTPVSACSADQEELRRSLLGILASVPRLVWLNEVPSPFGGKFWNGLTTAWPTYSDRVIRTSTQMEADAISCWVASGNNVMLQPDSTRRALHIRLEPQVERPEHRSDFRHPELLPWVESQQPRLLAAALTILRAFHLAGRPRVLPQPVGSFEEWDKLVRQAVGWVTNQDPLSPQAAIAPVMDTSRTAWADLLLGLFHLFGHTAFTAKDALERLQDPAASEGARQAVEELLPSGKFTTRAFAHGVLSRHRGSVVQGLRLVLVKAHTNQGALYRIESVPGSTAEKNHETTADPKP